MPDIHRYLSIRAATSGVLTADGEHIAFITNITGVPQVWSIPAGGGWPTQLTFDDHRVAGLTASPTDPSLVAFSRDDGGNERMQIHAVGVDGSGERPLAWDPAVIHRFGEFGPDGEWFAICHNRRNGVDFDLAVVGMDGSERLVTEMAGWNVVADVSDDGSTALVGHFPSNVQGEIRLVDLETGETTSLSEGDPAFEAPVVFGADGAVFAVTDRNGEYWRALRIIAGGKRTVFGPDDADVDALAVEGATGAMAWNDGGRSRLSWFDAATLEMGGEIALPLGVVGGLDIAEDGSMLISCSGSASPSDVWRVTGTEAERVTRSSTAGIDPASFVEPEVVAIASFDGLEVPAWVYRPQGVVRPPVIVSVHGGPESQERVGFNAVYQYLVAAGFAVVAPNVRGSSGYGKTYMSLDDVAKRPDSVRDLIEVGEWVRSRTDLDGSRMAVMGGSYGGYMVLAALTEAPGLWAAGVDIVGIANLVTFLENTGSYRRALREAEYGSLETDRALLDEISPIHKADRIAAPLLVIHGANDPRVPLGEAEQIVERVEANGKPVELLVFDDEGHGVVKLKNRVVAYGRVVEFLSDHLR